jgi:putative membrane protein insertion efficiency factor
MTRDGLASLAALPGRLIILVLIGLIRVYQWTLSPLLGDVCRFQPSCSRYMVEALRKYGLFRGLYKGGRRLLRCHPWSPGGYDPP